jgi:hypothetical protein
MIRTVFTGWSAPSGARSVSRRCFLQAAAGTVGALGAGLLLPTLAFAARRDPKPIPGGFANPAGGPFLHVNLPGPADAAPPNGNDPSLITDFDGFVGEARVQGTGTGTNTDTGETTPLIFDADLRFMQGLYQSLEGRFPRTIVQSQAAPPPARPGARRVAMGSSSRT